MIWEDPDLAMRLESLLEVSRQLSRIQSLESWLAKMAQVCGQLLDSDSVGIRVVEGDDLVVMGSWGDARQVIRRRPQRGCQRDRSGAAARAPIPPPHPRPVPVVPA
jgi:hypothetical protein